MTTLNMSFAVVNNVVGLSHDNIKSHVLGIMKDLDKCNWNCQYFKCDFEIILSIKDEEGKPYVKGINTADISSREEIVNTLETFLKEILDKGINKCISTVTPINISIPECDTIHRLPIETKKAAYSYQSVHHTSHKAIMALFEKMYQDYVEMKDKPIKLECNMTYLITDSECKESVNFISLSMPTITIKMNDKVKFIKYFSTLETAVTVFLSSRLVPDLMDLGSYIVTMKFVFDE